MMNPEARLPVFGALSSVLLTQGALLFLMVTSAGVGAVLLYPHVVAEHGWLVVLAAIVWGTVAAMATFYVLERRRRRGDAASTGRYGSPVSVEELADSLSQIVDLGPLLTSQTGKMMEFLGATRIAILTSMAQGEPYRVMASRGYEGRELSDVRLDAEGKLARWLKTNNASLILEENPGVAGYLDPEERQQLDRLEADAIFPLVAMSNLVGIVVAAVPQESDPGRLEAMTWLGPQMGMAVANAILLERQRLRVRRLYRAERLATTGQLAAGAAHEIRNPLASIRSSIQYLKKNEPEGSAADGIMDVLIRETDRINAIVQGMLSFARPAEPSLTDMDLCEVVSKTVRLVEPSAREYRVETEIGLPDEAAVVRGDPHQLEQVFLNVLMNAIQAMPRGGRLSVEVSRSEPPASDGRWQVKIEDSGPGIPKEHVERVFDPFFTTKPEGTGLGLSICHSILQAHGGDIDVSNGPDEGTVAVIRL